LDTAASPSVTSSFGPVRSIAEEHMDAGELIAIVSITGGLLLTALVVAGAWALGRLHERRDALASGGSPQEVAARLARVERMLETLSTDMERILEERRGPVLPRM
jgi:hypothetical protein